MFLLPKSKMRAAGWWYPRANIAALLLLTNAIKASLFSTCADPSSSIGECSNPLEDITVVMPGEFIVAKLQCYGCPTIARLEKGGHNITHEENALVCTLFVSLCPCVFLDDFLCLLTYSVDWQFLNISLSHDHTELLLNSVPAFPRLSKPPPTIIAAQVPLNFSTSSLSSSIECTQRLCRNFDNRCDCIIDNVGGMSLSYDYAAFPSPETSEVAHGWIIQLDAIGGHNGYMKDPYVEFNSPEQKVLQIYIQQHKNDGILEIMDTTNLIERQRRPAASKQELSSWEKILRFLGFENEKGREPGHIVYLLPEWDHYGRVGTSKHFLWNIWGKYPWGLISIIVGSVLGGLILLYAIYRFAVLVYNSPPDSGVQSTMGVDDEDNKWEERERLLDEEEDETGV
jgi:hypothetical protein